MVTLEPTVREVLGAKSVTLITGIILNLTMFVSLIVTVAK